MIKIVLIWHNPENYKQDNHVAKRQNWITEIKWAMYINRIVLKLQIQIPKGALYQLKSKFIRPHEIQKATTESESTTFGTSENSQLKSDTDKATLEKNT